MLYFPRNFKAQPTMPYFLPTYLRGNQLCLTFYPHIYGATNYALLFPLQFYNFSLTIVQSLS